MSTKKTKMPSIDIGISEADRAKIVKGLSGLLADSYTLYLMTHNFHWNVTGPQFNSLHAMFMGQYTEQWNALDQIAERIRALDACTDQHVTVEPHAQHVQGERQVFSSFRQQNVKSMGQMASQGVRSPSGGCPVDFQAVNFFAPPEQQGGFQAGNMPVQSVAQPVRGGAGRDAMGDLKYCSALRRSHIGKYED